VSVERTYTHQTVVWHTNCTITDGQMFICSCVNVPVDWSYQPVIALQT